MFNQTFLSCDWGTSKLRVRLVETATLSTVDEIETNEGVGLISKAGPASDRGTRFAEILQRHCNQLFRRNGISTDICVVSGMASSSIGWIELPYATAPLSLSPANLVAHTFLLGDLRIKLISGVRTDDDVMRGEETEIMGLLGLQPDIASAYVVLPGTHSKHIRLERNRLVGISTYMTGELYEHLTGCPTLQAALANCGPTFEPGFLAGVRIVREIGFQAALFKIRVRSLIADHDLQDGRSFLSGLLIGSELLDLPPNPPIFLSGAPSLSRLYTLAAESLGIPLRIVPPDTLRLAVLRAHREFLPSQS